MNRLLLLTTFLVFFALGCAGPTRPIDPGPTGYLADYTSGYIGCDPLEIEISDTKAAQRRMTWVATCRGRKFYCSDRTYLASGGGAIDMNCTEALP